MVAYNFKREFVGPIRSGRKRWTVRRNGKRPHAQRGQALQLYYGLRSSQAAKIGDAVCAMSLPIVIDVTADKIVSIELGGLPVDDLEQFAISDGFESLACMHLFFLNMHGVGRFEGTLIGWDEFRDSGVKIRD